MGWHAVRKWWSFHGHKGNYLNIVLNSYYHVCIIISYVAIWLVSFPDCFFHFCLWWQRIFHHHISKEKSGLGTRLVHGQQRMKYSIKMLCPLDTKSVHIVTKVSVLWQNSVQGTLLFLQCNDLIMTSTFTFAWQRCSWPLTRLSMHRHINKRITLYCQC